MSKKWTELQRFSLFWDVCFLSFSLCFCSKYEWTEEHDRKWEMKARICPFAQQIWLLSLLFGHFINTTAYHLDRYEPPSSTEEFNQWTCKGLYEQWITKQERFSFKFQYVCRRVPNKQAVVVMACDNAHMSDDMILEPGLVMIFAHGIEWLSRKSRVQLKPDLIVQKVILWISSKILSQCLL